MEKIYVVILEVGEYDEFERSVELVSTNLDLVKIKAQELFMTKSARYNETRMNVVIEVWQNNEHITNLEYEVKKIISYELFDWEENEEIEED